MIALLYSAADPNMGSFAFMVSSHCVGQTTPSEIFAKSSTIFADSQCVMPINGTAVLNSPICRAVVDDRLHIVFLDLFDDALTDVHRKRVVLIDHRHFDG